jgi:hypothetical protein
MERSLRDAKETQRRNMMSKRMAEINLETWGASHNNHGGGGGGGGGGE